MEEAGGALSQTNEHMAEFKDVLASAFVPDEDSDCELKQTMGTKEQTSSD